MRRPKPLWRRLQVFQQGPLRSKGRRLRRVTSRTARLDVAAVLLFSFGGVRPTGRDEKKRCFGHARAADETRCGRFGRYPGYCPRRRGRRPRSARGQRLKPGGERRAHEELRASIRHQRSTSTPSSTTRTHITSKKISRTYEENIKDRGAILTRSLEVLGRSRKLRVHAFIL